MARLEEPSYDSDVVGNRGAGMEHSTGIVVFPWLAPARLERAPMLLTRRTPGDAGRAQELLGRALPAARELGLGKVDRDAVALLQ